MDEEGGEGAPRGATLRRGAQRGAWAKLGFVKTFLVLGAGFTGSRVAKLLGEAGHQVVALRRAQIDFTQDGAAAQLAEFAPLGCRVLHSVPSLPGLADAALLEGLRGRAERVVYLSTTGVYGDVDLVDEQTAVGAPSARWQTEEAVRAGAWSSLILRPAAIYGPGRGVHVAMAQGRYTLLGDGSNYISRIQVDDLARLAVAGLLSDVEGSYPVADRYPCMAREIAEYCSQTLGVPMAVSAPVEEVPLTRRNNRRVDARAIFGLLGVDLLYPSYREGIAASIASMR
jgi:nucleoside-diphosphate-sugar epimerase